MSEVAPLSCEALSWHRGGRAILSDITLALGAGELMAIIGPNGAGKSSLLRALMGLVPEVQGSVKLDDVELAAIDSLSRAKKVAYMPQQQPIAWPLTVRHTVELGRLPHMGFRRRLGIEDNAAVNQAMQMTDIVSLSDRSVDTLSGGEFARVMIARLFAGKAPLILADEPIASLDPYHQLHIMELLRLHCQQGGAAVVVMHDLTMAARFCQRIVVMQHGTVVADGAPLEVLTDELLGRVYGVSVTRHENVVVPSMRLI